jgi:hypothetical protein
LGVDAHSLVLVLEVKSATTHEPKIMYEGVLFAPCPKVFAIIVMNYDVSDLEAKEHFLPKHVSSL